jgi:hypothetical protein
MRTCRDRSALVDVDARPEPGWDGMMDPLDTVFRHLAQWRHLPAYQLERRADVFFSVYLRDVVEEVTGVPLEDVMIPEFPVKHDGTHESDKVDYVLFAKDRSRVYFVELKTDGGSRRPSQDAYLKRAASRGFRHAVEGVRAIKLRSKEYGKYHHLAVLLQRLGYLSLPDNLADHIYREPRRGLSKLLERVVVAPLDSTIEVIYVQPHEAEGDRCIDFERFATHVRRHADVFSASFAAALMDWRRNAGSCPPA